jgi:hypothetical protein
LALRSVAIRVAGPPGLTCGQTVTAKVRDIDRYKWTVAEIITPN